LYVSINTEGKVESGKVTLGTGDASVDAALLDAVGECRFEPKYTITPATGVKSIQTEFRELFVQWPVPVPTWGAHLCFTPEYPHAVRRSEAEGLVTVMATKQDAESAPELKLVEPSSRRPELRQLTLEVVAACFAHRRTHADMPTERGIQYRYQWVLR